VALLTAGFHWVKIDIEKAPGQMFICLYGGSVVSFFPEGPFSPLLLVLNLPNSASNQLHQSGNGLGLLWRQRQDMDMIRSDHEVEDWDFIPIGSLIQPLHPEIAVDCMVQKELTIMAPMRNMPDSPWNKESYWSRHFST
jgi:hypothetical protein